MSALQKELQGYISILPDSALIALKPLLTLLVSAEPIVETNLTDEEKELIKQGREEYAKGTYIPLDSM